MDTASATNPPGRRPQPSSFPFLLITALLFYFFSRSPSAPHTHARDNLVQALAQRQQEVVGLKNWLNSTFKDPIGSHTSSNLSVTDAAITKSLCNLPSRTFGSKSLVQGRQFAARWIDSAQVRPDRKMPPVFWRNLTGSIKGNWRWREESREWYPPAWDNRSAWIHETVVSAVNSTFFNSSFAAQRGKFPWFSHPFNRSKAPGLSYPSSKDLKIAYNLRESPLQLVRLNTSLIRGSMSFSAPDSKDVTLDVEGVHFQDNGTLYLRAWPPPVYLDTRGLLAHALDAPHLAHPSLNDSDSFVPPPTTEQIRIGHVVLSDLEARQRRIESMLQKGDIPDDEDDSNPSHDLDSPNCTFLVYGALTPLSTSRIQTAQSLREYEDSLTTPTGASIPVPSPPHPIIQSLMISPNCGLVLEMKESPVILAPIFWIKSRMYGLIAGLITGAQCWLLVWQMDNRQSPSSLSRMSYLSLITQVVMDAWIFSSHLTLAILTNNTSTQPLMIPAFFACLSAILFGMRYGTLIRVHAPSPSPSLPPPPPPQGVSEIVVVPNTADVTASSLENRPLIGSLPTDMTHRRSRFDRLFGVILSLVPGRAFIAIAATSMCIMCIPFVLYTWQPLILCILYSYWIPQIIHNVQHGTGRRGLRKRFVIGSTVLRLFLPLYVWGCPTNVFPVDPNPWIWMLAVYSISQAGLLVLQDYFGARFFLLTAWFPDGQTWDYHPVQLPALADLEGAQKMPECVVCFESINALPHDERGERGMFGRWSYMVPPCHHIAHTRCLEAWLAIKSECPVCRRPLPPT